MFSFGRSCMKHDLQACIHAWLEGSVRTWCHPIGQARKECSLRSSLGWRMVLKEFSIKICFQGLILDGLVSFVQEKRYVHNTVILDCFLLSFFWGHRINKLFVAIDRLCMYHHNSFSLASVLVFHMIVY